MRRMFGLGGFLLLVSLGGGVASADPEAPKPAEASQPLRPLTREESLVRRARELVDRARSLDDTAAAEDKAVAAITARLPALRLAAKAARDRADRAEREHVVDAESLLAKAEDLEVDLAVSEAEVPMKRHAAVEDRRAARDLRRQALRLVRDPPEEDDNSVASACDPPYRFTPNGRKMYRIECLK